MSEITVTPPESDRAAQRRHQVLDAAAICFRNHGFHGASMAQISKTAGMSPGHIYHYFDNKEAIIAAIVERDMEEMIVRWLPSLEARMMYPSFPNARSSLFFCISSVMGIPPCQKFRNSETAIFNVGDCFLFIIIAFAPVE
jgi:AcrR family transcriptional regulator